MTNSDTAYGTHNKTTWIYTQHNDGSTALINFSDTAAAKTYYFTNEALAVFDECCTQLQWALVDAQTLKITMAFGVVADSDTAGWADTFNSRKNALKDQHDDDSAVIGFHKHVWPQVAISDSSEHLF
jgi:hypothetical protein